MDDQVRLDHTQLLQLQCLLVEATSVTAATLASTVTTFTTVQATINYEAFHRASALFHTHPKGRRGQLHPRV